MDTFPRWSSSRQCMFRCSFFDGSRFREAMSFRAQLEEFFPPATKYSPGQIPDLHGKVAVVTGGYGGIGLHTVSALIQKGATVYILGRSIAKYNTAFQSLEAESSSSSASDSTLSTRVQFIQCDLGSLSSVHKAAAELSAKTSVIDLLFCSAGVMLTPSGSKTADGYEMQFGTNVIGHWVLTMDVLPLLKASQGARVVFTSSLGHRAALTGCINYASLKADAKGVVGGGLYSFTLYGQSKIGDIIIANEFQRRYGEGIVFTSCHPGNLKTDLAREIKGTYASRFVTPIMEFVENLMCYPAPMGALTQLYAATAPEAADKGGAYFVPWARIGIARADAQDPRIGRELWEWLEKETT